MTPELARALLTRHRNLDRNRRIERIRDPNFPEQDRFVTDPSRSIIAQCTRRAGKSNGLALRLYRAALKWPNSGPLYIALTRDSAKKIMWPVMYEMNQKFNLRADLVESNLTITLPNRSQISLVGADMKNFIERLRGPKYPEVAIDEGQAFRSHIKELIEDILEPATLDYDGTICVTGTPGIVPDGYFHEACQGKLGYSIHKWSLFQNPYLPNAQDFVNRLIQKRQWTSENPTLRREYYNEWVIDLDALVYKFKKERNLYARLPAGQDYLRILSIDYGWNDQTAFAIVSYSHTLRHVYVEHVEGHSELTPSAIAGRIQGLQERFSPIRIVADTGGLGKSITEEMIRRYHIPIKPANKTEKLTNISLLNGDFIDQILWIHEDLGELQEQYLKLTKGDDGMEDPSLPNDLCDAVLYGYREAKHYLGEVPSPKLQPNTPAAHRAEADRMLEAELEELANGPKTSWWEQ